MRAILTCAILTATILTVNPSNAFAQHRQLEGLVDSWYHRYLHRHADAVGLHDHVQALRRGVPAEAVEASILESKEYYHRTGCTPEGFVAALYRDVLRRAITIHELQREVDCLRVHGRHAVVRHVLRERSHRVIEPTIISSYSPSPSIIVAQPRMHGHGHGHHVAPVVIDPRPSISIRFNFGR